MQMFREGELSPIRVRTEKVPEIGQSIMVNSTRIIERDSSTNELNLYLILIYIQLIIHEN